MAPAATGTVGWWGWLGHSAAHHSGWGLVPAVSAAGLRHLPKNNILKSSGNINKK